MHVELKDLIVTGKHTLMNIKSLFPKVLVQIKKMSEHFLPLPRKILSSDEYTHHKVCLENRYVRGHLISLMNTIEIE